MTRSKMCLAVLVLLGGATISHAAVTSDSTVTLTLDWSSLDSFVTWQPANFKYNGADADLDGVTDSSYQTEGGWVGDPALTYTAQVTADAIGSASTTMDSANATAHARADGIGISSPPYENVSASGTSHRGKVFSPLTDSSITFSFAYSISQNFSKDDPTETYSSWSIAELHLSDSTNSGTQVAHDEFVLNNAGTTETGFLGFTVDLLASHYYYLEGHVYTSSCATAPEQAVTVPAPGALLLAGLGSGLVAYMRRRRRL